MTAKKKVLFFSPHAGIWPHALGESYLAKSLDPEVFDVARVTCSGTFDRHCTVMSSLAIELDRSDAEKASVCKRCAVNSDILRRSYRGRDFVIADFLTEQDRAAVDEIVAGLDERNFQDLIVDGIEIAKVASYEILIRFKKTSLTFSSAEFAYLKTYIGNALLSLSAFRKIYERFEPDILVTYSPQYGVNGVCARYCEMRGKKVYFIEGSSNINERYRALRVWDWTTFGLTNPALRYWRDLSRYRLTEEDTARVRKHMECLLNASSFSVYSEPASGSAGLHERFGVPVGAKLLLAAMSSYDEVFSAFVIDRFPSSKYYSDVFADQLEWIRRTIEFVGGRKDLFLIVRIHPRTFPGKRNSVMAAEQIELARILDSLPANVRANYPEDKISIYDLYREIDVLITGWSATGVEAMAFGVPVVTYDSNLPSYPASIHFTGRSVAEYQANILKAAEAGRSDRIADDAYRWLTFSMSLGVVRHPTTMRYSEIAGRFKPLGFAVRVLEKIVPSIVKRLEARRPVAAAAEIQRVNALFASGGRSLYDT